MTATWAAPGRVNLIGEHVDYQDGLVLPFAVSYSTTTTVSRRADDRVVVTSDEFGTADFSSTAEPGDVSGWAAYVAGVLWAFREAGHRIDGLDISVASDVPAGAGLSSSAALTCSVGCAVDDELGLGLDRVAIATAARRAENDFAGAPTGQMDQLASMLCEQGCALLLDCRSLQTRSIPLDLAGSALRLLLVDTHARHQLVAGGYGARRADCEAAAAELRIPTLRDASLAQVSSLTDGRLRRRAHHVVTEIDRVRQVAAVLDAGHPEAIGGFLTASHLSLRDDFEVSCAELDAAVDSALAAGALGARLVGGGFGGCVIALVREAEVAATTDAVEAAFDGHGWQRPTIHSPVPSSGAHKIG